MSVMNLLDFQCWAATKNLLVVEPSLDGPYSKFTFDETLAQSWLHLKDVYNVSEWKRHSLRTGLSPLVEQEEFFRVTLNRTMRVILVQFQQKKRDKCSFWWPKHANKGFLYAIKQWEVVKTVCVLYSHSSFDNFNEKIFRDMSTHNLVVIFNIWPGFEPIYIKGALRKCKEGRKFVCQKPPSKRLMNDAMLYADKYLGGFGNYIAIAARFEKPVTIYWKLTPQQFREEIEKRIAETTKVWEGLKRNTSLSSTFLGFDYGSFGSDTFKRKKYYGTGKTLEQFHQTVYDNRLSLPEWERSFEGIAHTNSIAYITLLQFQIAVHAKCLVIVGMWSNYQKVLHQVYLAYHPTNACVRVVGAVGSKHC